ncbi:MAG: VTT domain-containing protein [Leptospira sp.]|nr:VTT domain-containing protein [Leptospira sp.]
MKDIFRGRNTDLTPQIHSKKENQANLVDSLSDSREESLVRLFAQTIFAILIVVVIVLLLGVYAREELIFYSEMFIRYVGYPGLFLGMLMSDSLPAFVPPDAFLMFSIAAGLDAFWVLFSTSVGSIVGGCISYSIGRFLIPRFSLGRKIILRYEDKLLPYLRRFGFWAIVLAAMTPIPYSWMAYTVGSFKMSFKMFLVASQFRILRMVVYYYAMLWGWM